MVQEIIKSAQCEENLISEYIKACNWISDCGSHGANIALKI